MTDRLEALVRTRWQEAGLPGRPPAQISFHLFEGTPGPHGVVSFHAFRSGDPTPVLVGKIPRDGTARRLVTAEHELLEELAETAPRLAGAAFPRTIWLGDQFGRVATAQPPLTGRPLIGSAQTVLDTAQDWLARFWRATGFLEGTEAALWERFLRSAHFYRQAFDPDPAIVLELDSLILDIEERSGRTALCGFAHGALVVDRFLRAGDQLRVLGWEHAEKRQFPWFDPLHLALDLAVRDADDAVRGFELAFVEEGPARAATARFLRACCDEGAVATEVLSLAIPATVLAIVHRQSRLWGPRASSTRQWRAVLESCLLIDLRSHLDEFLRLHA